MPRSSRAVCMVIKTPFCSQHLCCILRPLIVLCLCQTLQKKDCTFVCRTHLQTLLFFRSSRLSDTHSCINTPRASQVTRRVLFFLLEHIRKNYSADISSLIMAAGGGSERRGALADASVPAALAAEPQTPAFQCHSCCCHQPRKHMTPTPDQPRPHQLPSHPRRAEAWSGAAHVRMDGWKDGWMNDLDGWIMGYGIPQGQSWVSLLRESLLCLDCPVWADVWEVKSCGVLY